ncbi:response regulator [Desulfospira joergensenii]|uniref:response regulator n=1 Tax=Desulfospira joergensenii TaxID=53329 RepID=UPI0003B6F7F7|nr:response regulator [Desulfospira joergensenii]
MKINVLMVDDEKRFRETTRKLLMRKGFETEVAESGEHALEILEQEGEGKRPDVIILDIKMPGMDGHETLEKIKAILPRVPVIMLTGHGDRPSAKEALSGGAFDYLSKPCDIDLLAEKIREALGRPDRLSGGKENPLTVVMIPLAEYTMIQEDRTIEEAVDEIKRSFRTRMATRQLMETGHRSVLVMEKDGGIMGILTIRDLLEAVMPAYLNAPKPSLADSIEYSPMFWKGLFHVQIRENRNKRVHEIMSPSPCSIDAGSTLMEAAFLMVTKNHRRLMVTQKDQPIGVIREQDLFFEMEKMLTA